MMLLRIEQQKIRILKMSRDFTDLPTDKLADLKTKKNLTALLCDRYRKNQKNKRKKVRLVLTALFFYGFAAGRIPNV